MASKRYAQVNEYCVACGSCTKVCPLSAIAIWKGVFAQIDEKLCVGCGKCTQECPAGAIQLKNREVPK